MNHLCVGTASNLTNLTYCGALNFLDPQKRFTRVFGVDPHLFPLQYQPNGILTDEGSVEFH